jgi:ureidoacrylate peracid hydrolase
MDILDQLKPFLDDANITILSKTRNSAFHSTTFATQLREKGTEQLVVTGVLTNACVEGTVRDAFSQGFRVLVLREATTTGKRVREESELREYGVVWRYR